MEVIGELISKIKSLTVIEDINLVLNSHDLVCHYEKTNERKSPNGMLRLILRIKKNNNVHPLVYYYCNGCVIDTIKWKVVSMPPMTFNKRQMPTLIESYFKQKLYDVIKVIDGTVVTIYYFNNRWNISSSNNYDISPCYWMGNLTYAEVIYDLLKRLYPNAIEQNGVTLIDNISLQFSKLQKNKSYTIGFRHHNFHPLLDDPERMWNIQITNLDNGNVEYNHGLKGIPNQQVITAVDSLDQLFHLNKVNTMDIVKAENNGVYNYGYILRSKNIEATKEYSNIILYSTLLKGIKKSIYEYSSDYIKQYINHENRFEYIALKNFFNKIERNDIIQLYPQMIERYKVYSQCINDAISCMIIIMKSKHNNIQVDSSSLTFQPCIITLAFSLIKHITKYEALDPYHKDIESILKDYIMNVEYSILFLHAINKYNQSSTN